MYFESKHESDYLEHHGVKGMKWGRRKDRGIVGTGEKRIPGPTSGGLDNQRRKLPSTMTKDDVAKSYNKMKLAKFEKKNRQKDFDKAYARATSPMHYLRNKKNRIADNNDLERTAADSRKADKEYKESKKAYKAVKKMQKQQIKDIKKEYQKEFLAGQSAVGKLYSKYTGAHRGYADMMYDMNKRAKVNKAWKD